MILACQSIQKAFGTDVILKNASFHIEDREKAAIVGINGAGKSTLLKIIMHQLDPDSGDVILAKGKTIGYLAQHDAVSSENTIHDELLSVKAELLAMEKRIRELELEMKSLSGEALESVLETYNRLNSQFERENGYAIQSELTGVLKGLGFTEEDFTKKVSTLSGGQKTRVALGKLLLSHPDLILLDEPTNHLDITSKEILENALNQYEGTVLYVSHDRYFINQTATRILELTGNTLVNYIGNYDYYLEKKEELTAIYVPGEAASAVSSDKTETDSKLDWQQQKELQAKERKRKNALKKTEDQISALEERDAEIDALMASPEVATDVGKCIKLSKEKAQISEELATLYETWEELAEDE